MDYFDKTYRFTSTNGCDALTVDKSRGSDWCSFVMKTNGEHNGAILIRSKEQLELLGFMISQVLAEG